MRTRFNIIDILFVVTLVGVFMGFVNGEPRAVIWSLAIYSVTCMAGLILLARSAKRFWSWIVELFKTRSVHSLVPRQIWKQALLDAAMLTFLTISITTANYSVAEGNGFNAVLVLAPIVAGYLIWRFFVQLDFDLS